MSGVATRRILLFFATHGLKRRRAKIMGRHAAQKQKLCGIRRDARVPRGISGFLKNLPLENPKARKITVQLDVIQPKSQYKRIRNFETSVSDWDIHKSAIGFIHRGAYRQAAVPAEYSADSEALVLYPQYLQQLVHPSFVLPNPDPSISGPLPAGNRYYGHHAPPFVHPYHSD